MLPYGLHTRGFCTTRPCCTAACPTLPIIIRVVVYVHIKPCSPPVPWHDCNPCRLFDRAKCKMNVLGSLRDQLASLGLLVWIGRVPHAHTTPANPFHPRFECVTHQTWQVNVNADERSWEHEVLALERVPAGTLSGYGKPANSFNRSPLKGDTSAEDIQRVVTLVGEALARVIYGSSGQVRGLVNVHKAFLKSPSCSLPCPSCHTLMFPSGSSGVHWCSLCGQ